MHWIAPSSKDLATATLEKRLWSAADELRANSGLTAAQYSQPVLGLIFLRFADAKFAAHRVELEKGATGRRGSRVDDVNSYHANSVLLLPPEAANDVPDESRVIALDVARKRANQGLNLSVLPLFNTTNVTVPNDTEK